MKNRHKLFGAGFLIRYILGTFLLMTVSAGVLSGCSIEETNGTKLKDLNYTIVEDADIPEELL